MRERERERKREREREARKLFRGDVWVNGIRLRIASHILLYTSSIMLPLA